MLLRIIMLFVLCIATLSMSSCTTSHDYSYQISCEKFAENSKYSSEVTLEVGDKIRLELCSNRTAGFKWEYKFTLENVVEEEDYDFEEPGADVVGAPGKELWTFEAVNTGTTEIQMEYSQPWEGGTKAEWTYIIKVTVQ